MPLLGLECWLQEKATAITAIISAFPAEEPDHLDTFTSTLHWSCVLFPFQNIAEVET